MSKQRWRRFCRNSRCTLPARESALEATPTGIAVFVLVLAILVVVTVACKMLSR